MRLGSTVCGILLSLLPVVAAANKPDCRVLPEFASDGTFQGLKVYDIRNLAVAIGLHNGDVVREVNGKPLKGEEDAGLLMTLPKSGVHLVVERKGEVIKLP